MKVTSATIAPNNSQAVWTDVIPQLAADHLFVLQGIFAVGSLHLSRSGANERDQKLFSNIAAGQLSVGLSQFRSAIQKPTEQNVEALCAFNTVTTSFMLTSAAEESKTIIQLLQKNILTKGQRQKVINDLVHVTSRVFRSFRGVMIFLVPFWYHLMEGRLAPLLNRAWWPLSVVTTPQAFEEDRILRNLERMWMNSGREYEIYNDHLKAALKHLRETFALASQLTTHAQTTNTTFDWSSVFTWPIASTFDFIDLIERQQYEAWVIVAHWAVLPSRIENVWWIDLAPNIIATAAYALDESKWHLIEWPARVVGVDLENFRVPTTSLPQLGKPLESPVKSSTSQDGTTVVDRGRLHLSNFGP
ncbi:hypothetical protein K504DRAFT_26888 [Pleomassaria siparia CBS 279.74]|uniref:Uncharacterized protein n=1 Tax=Pleomassaria siparia CBS 279.74 TaxID=1314801 RepID=A0A6G1KSR4_9PLEO|nr:hypothetical protein K504DRAFT_26888 [Pleomassaria siparia CBS 279.74]